MKRCPACSRVYSDDTLTFCLEDGAALALETSSGSDLAATIIMPDPRTTTPVPGQTSSFQEAPGIAAARQHIGSVNAAWSPPPPLSLQTSARPGRGLAIASLVLAIGAFLILAFCFIAGATGVNESLIGGIFIFAALLGLVGAVVGILAMAKSGKDQSPHSAKVTAVVGLILNISFLLVVIAFLILGAVATSR